MTNHAVTSIIGGVFALESADVTAAPAEPPAFMRGPTVLLANGRGAISLLCARLGPRRVWLPACLCDSMVQSSPVHGAEGRFYPVDSDLGCRDRHWLDEVRRGDLAIPIDYSGFLCDPQLVTEPKQRGAWVVQDACQALLSDHGQTQADFLNYSPRKFVGVPDGGVLMIRIGMQIPIDQLEPPPTEWWLKALSVTVGRRDFDRAGGGERRWFRMHQELERSGPIEAYQMSDLSRCLLERGIDFASVVQRRCANYQVLLRRLRPLAVFPDLPLGFPVRLRNRDAARQRLFDHAIYPPVHRPIAGLVPAEFEISHELNRRIMTLPCDQRYDEKDMSRMADLLQDEPPA
ncbi:MAG: hypothetical protein WD042_05865 [Phycisphaeraceae bacterium]